MNYQRVPFKYVVSSLWRKYDIEVLTFIGFGQLIVFAWLKGGL